MIFLALPALSLLESCHFDDEMIYPPGTNMDPNTYFGQSVSMGNGEAKAWVAVNKNGEPRAVGINFSKDLLEGLPEEPASIVLDFPADKGKGFYTHATLDWNPEGHEPPGLYDKPHFDIHFYIISKEDRMAIGPNDTVEFAKEIDAKYVPASYLHTQGGVPQMGAHWVDTLSGEFTGKAFDKTFILGSYDGEFIFWEPMVTLDYFLSEPYDVVPLRQPQAFQRDGWYPTKYKVSYSSAEEVYTVALTNLKYHKGE